MKKDKKRIAITGGYGFIGKYVLEELANNYDVLVLSRNSEKNESFKAPHELQQTDYSYDSLASCLKNLDGVIHLASVRLQTQGLASLGISNSVLDFNVFNACKTNGIKNIVFTSSVAVYGTQYETPRQESSILSPENEYALAKRLSEEIALYFNAKGLSIKCLRVAQVMGWGENDKNLLTIFIKNAMKGDYLDVKAVGPILREYIYVKDLALGIVMALEQQETSGVFNIGGGFTGNPENIARKIIEVFTQAKLRIDPHAVTRNEYSMMDSSKFRNTFQWNPKFDLDLAIKDIKKILS